MDDENGLFNIQLSDDEADKQDEKPGHRTDQPESEYQAVKRDYHVKVENGNIYKSINLPLAPKAAKLHTQEVLHAVEELYFFRRYQDAIQFVDTVLDPAQGGPIEDALKDSLNTYRSRCHQKMKNEE